MLEWTLVGTATPPNSKETLSLLRSRDDFVIRLSPTGTELMSTRRHGSEDALGTLPFACIDNREDATVLVGGLGMGFTLAAVLRQAGPAATVVVAEIVPEVLQWNRGPLGEKSGRPLDDPRTTVYDGDVSDLIRDADARYDIVTLDVDNGPEGLTVRENDWIYSDAGVQATRKALRPRGIAAYWSAKPDPQFTRRLRRFELVVEERQVYAHGSKGTRHTLWLAQRKTGKDEK